jgi:tripartite-type tricarboxylate transporter receptor subunit TctC
MHYKNSVRILLGVIALSISCVLLAQDYPNRPIKIIVPFGAGAPDSVARIISQRLSAQLGQPVIVENRAGANGIIGSDLVAKSTPDGYTLLITTVSFVVNPSVKKKLPYEPLKDFLPITNICDQEAMLLVINPAVKVQSVQELIAYAKKPESKMAYASIGVGNTTHLAGELFNVRTGINAVHVPYKGGSEAVTGVISGDVQMMIVPATQSLQFIKSGKLKALAYTNRTRFNLLPDVPTMAESGVSGMEFQGGWFGLFAPAGTPLGVATRLANEVKLALTQNSVKDQMANLGLRPIGTAPQEFAHFVEDEIKNFVSIVRLTGIQPD